MFSLVYLSKAYRGFDFAVFFALDHECSRLDFETGNTRDHTREFSHSKRALRHGGSNAQARLALGAD